MPAINSGLCLTPGCHKQRSQWKGLCMKCYHEAKGIVESGKTTWDQLATIGLAETEETPFQKAFREKNNA